MKGSDILKAVDIKEFVLSFVHLRDPEEAAINAGIPPLRARAEGLALLDNCRVKRRIAAAEKKRRREEIEIRAGLERLAYGRANDAAALAFAEEVTPHMLACADLYNVSEIKRIKGGGVEIKFFDRQKALERLAELDRQLKSDRKAHDLVNAIYGSETAAVDSDPPLEGEQS